MAPPAADWSRSDLLQVLSRALAALRIALLFVGNLLAFVQGAETGTLDRRDMHEHIRPTGLRLNEAVSLGAVEPLDGTDRHRSLPKLDCIAPHPRGASHCLQE